MKGRPSHLPPPLLDLSLPPPPPPPPPISLCFSGSARLPVSSLSLSRCLQVCLGFFCASPSSLQLAYSLCFSSRALQAALQHVVYQNKCTVSCIRPFTNGIYTRPGSVIQSPFVQNCGIFIISLNYNYNQSLRFCWQEVHKSPDSQHGPPASECVSHRHIPSAGVRQPASICMRSESYAHLLVPFTYSNLLHGHLSAFLRARPPPPHIPSFSLLLLSPTTIHPPSLSATHLDVIEHCHPTTAVSKQVWRRTEGEALQHPPNLGKMRRKGER
jgi:hypothetical protein